MEITPHVRHFEQHRSMLYGIAYRMLGRMSEAEDIVQDAYVRWQGVQLGSVENAAAYLASTVTRLCIDRQRKARIERILYTGPWLPEPIGDETLAAIDPARQAEASEHISMAFMMLLEKLQPLERAVFILREAFDLAHDDIAAMLDIRVTHSRQLLRRAKLRMQGEIPQYPASEDAEPLMSQFIEAAASGDLDGLKALMADDIIAYSDGGGRVSAALIPLIGPDKVSTVLMHLVSRNINMLTVEWQHLNGQLSLVMKSGDEVHSTHCVTVRGGKIHRIFSVRNPDKLHYLS